jgi:carboxyl-terminal processing protease
LIIDLRGNPGGVYPVRKAIASQFFDESVLLWNYVTRPGLDLPGFEREAYAEPPNDPYMGPVVVLVDELCTSSCEEFSGALQANQRAAIIGGWTSGSDLVMDVMILSSGASFGYPIAQTQTSDGRVLEGNGVIPDVQVRLDRELLLRGVDSQLQAAVEFLAKELEE